MPAPDTVSQPAGIDPRGPRFVASVKATLLLVVVFLNLVGQHLASLVLLGVLVAIFLWSAIAGVRNHPFSVFFRLVVRPRLKPPAELEDPRPPTFSMLVGFLVTGIGFLLALLLPVDAAGLPASLSDWAIVIAVAAAFVAAFLNAAFAFCLGCEIYLLLVRAGLIRPKTPLIA